MKVLHIVAGEINKGAGRGAYWLHLALKEKGVDSKILTNSFITLGDDNVITISGSKIYKVISSIRSQLDDILTMFYPARKKVIFSSGLFGIDITKTIEYKDADIIHLHWINAGFIDIKCLKKIVKPIVWTMRDMWPFTGGCHYSMECLNYKTGCGKCEQLGSVNNFDLSKFINSRKKKYFPENMKIVGISPWLSEEAQKSRLFKNFNVSTIQNNVNVDEFFSVDKEVARNILGIETKKKIILIGAVVINDYYKGFSKYLEAIKSLDCDKYYLCFFGTLDKSVIDRLDFEYKSFNYLHDNVSLRLLYSCADVFVAPSLMDAFGKTIVEAMSCGTPVVCFDATGPQSIITHKVDGYKAIPFKSKDLAAGVEWISSSPDYMSLANNAREKVSTRYDSKVVAKKYIELYEKILI